MALWGATLAAAQETTGQTASVAQQETTVQNETAPAAVVTELEAPTHESLWDRANTAYINDDYAEAIRIYEMMLSDGVRSAKLYYNLGNAFFKRDEIGKAILYYHRALRLAPGDEDIRHNLSVAEARTKDTIDRIPEFFLTTWVRSLSGLMSSTAWTVLSLVALVAMLALLLLFLLARRLSLRKSGFYGTLAAALLFALTTWFALGQRSAQLNTAEAVVMSSSAAVKSSPDRAATDLFVLHEGTIVEVTNRLGDWSEVVIADGKKGWTESRKIEAI